MTLSSADNELPEWFHELLLQTLEVIKTDLADAGLPFPSHDELQSAGFLETYSAEVDVNSRVEAPRDSMRNLSNVLVMAGHVAQRIRSRDPDFTPMTSATRQRIMRFFLRAVSSNRGVIHVSEMNAWADDLSQSSPAAELARKRHAENYALLADAIKFWRENIDPNLSASKAASELIRVVPLSHKKLAEVVSAEKKKLA